MANNRRSRRRGSRRRGGTGFYVFAALVVLALGALAYIGGSSIIDTTLRADSDSVQRVEDPTGAEAPELVEEASIEEESAEEKSTEESAEEKSTEESAEEKSTEEPSEEEIAAAEEADTETAEEVAAEEAAIEEEAVLKAELPTEEGIPADEEPVVAEEEEDEVAVAPGDPTMYLSVPKLGINGAIVAAGEAGLEMGAMHLDGTGYPWQPGSNTYVAGHRIGFPGSGSDRIFYDLPNLAAGDTVTLSDSMGQEYNYVVSEMFAVTPFDVWVTAPTGSDMVTLQVCTETPDDWFTIGPKLMDSGPESGRLIVRAVKA